MLTKWLRDQDKSHSKQVYFLHFGCEELGRIWSMYGVESWKIAFLGAFPTHLYTVLNIYWLDKVTKERVRELTGQDQLLSKIREHRLRWWGHVESRTTDGGWKTSKTGTQLSQLDSWGITQDRSTANHLEWQHNERHNSGVRGVHPPKSHDATFPLPCLTLPLPSYSLPFRQM